MSWELTSDRPIYLQLAEHIKIDIMSGKYQPGSKIESVRELAIEDLLILTLCRKQCRI